MITIEELKKFQEIELNEVKHENLIEMEELLEFQRRAVEALQHSHQVKIESLQLRFQEEMQKFVKSDHNEQVKGSCQRSRPWESMSYGNEAENSRTIKIMKTPEKILGLRRTIKAMSTQPQQPVTGNQEAGYANAQTPGKPTTSGIVSSSTTINCRDTKSTSKSSITISKITPTSTIAMPSKTINGKQLAETSVKSTLSLKNKRPRSTVDKEVCTNDLMILENEDQMEKDSKKPKLVEKSSVVIANELRLNYLQKKKELFKKIKSTNKMHELNIVKAKNHQVVKKSVFSAKENRIVEKEIIISNNGKMFQISNKA